MLSVCTLCEGFTKDNGILGPFQPDFAFLHQFQIRADSLAGGGWAHRAAPLHRVPRPQLREAFMRAEAPLDSFPSPRQRE